MTQQCNRNSYKLADTTRITGPCTATTAIRQLNQTQVLTTRRLCSHCPMYTT